MMKLLPTKLAKHLTLSLLLLSISCVNFTVASTSAYFLDTSRMELQVTPETHTASSVIKVTSNSTQTIRLRVIPKLWTLNPDGVLVYQEPPAPSEKQFNLLENIGVNPREFDLLPGKTKLVRFVVKTPEGVQNAEYPFQLYFEPVSLLEQGNKQEAPGVHNVLDVVPVFTTTVYVYQGHPTPDVKVEKFTCGYDPKQAKFDVNLNLTNEGNKHARLFGNLIVSPESGPDAHKPLDVLHMQNSTLIIVFPGAERRVENHLTPSLVSKLKAGNYEMDLQLVDERNVQLAIPSICHFTVSGS